jgi:C4-dicarboxylate-binding protein DctP
MRRLARIGPAAPTAVLLLTALLAAGCASGTKAGGSVTHPIRIAMQSPDSPDPNSSYFASQVQKLSGGRIQIVVGNGYSGANSGNEARLVRALRSGKVKMAYIASRAWEEGSQVTAFRALQAPLLVTNYPLLRRITTGPIGRSMLESLDSIGIVGLGLVPERLRRLFGRTPLDSAATLDGARIRPVASPTGEKALRALGAVPVVIPSSRAAGPALGRHEIDGVESETISIEQNYLWNYGRDLTANIALFSKATTIAIRKSVFDRLSAADRSILRNAADATVLHADPAAAERTDLKALCRQGIDVVTATPADLASLERLAPAGDAILERDPITRREIKAIERLQKTHPTPVSALPPCPAAKSVSLPEVTRSPLDGTWVMTASRSETNPGPPSTGPANNNYGAFLFVFHDGRFRLSDHRPAGELVQGYSTGWTSGTYTIRGNRLTFVMSNSYGDTPLGNRGDRAIVVTWSLDRNTLTFQHVGLPRLFFKPWDRGPAPKPAAAKRTAARIAGTYVMNISLAEQKAHGLINWGVTRLVLGAKSFRISDRRPAGQPLVQGHSSGWSSGTYATRVDKLTFFIRSGSGDTPLGGRGDTPIVVRWSLDRGTLTLQQGKKNEGGAGLWLKPWNRVS